MEFVESILYTEVQEIFKLKDSKTNFAWEAEIYYNEALFINPLKVVAIGISREYVGNFADEITTTMLVPLGQYVYKILANKGNLKIVLKKRHLGEQVSKEIDNDSSIAVAEYSAILLNDEPDSIIGQGREANSEDVLDLTAIKEVKFQLIDINVEKIRTIQVGGAYNNFMTDELLKSVITLSTQGLIKGLSVIPPNNQKMTRQLVIPHSTSLVKLPDLVQAKVGIYNGGLGSYIQDGFWYIYYLYNTDRLEDRTNTINVIVVPEGKFPNVERSYKNVNGDITIVVSGKTSYIDDNGIGNINEGHGARISNADMLLTGSSVLNKGNKTLVSRAKQNSEFVAYARQNKINFAPQSSNKISNNPFQVYSEINRRTGGRFNCVWQSADYTLLKPGQPAKIHYLEGEEVKTLNAILISAKYISMMLEGITGERYNNQGILSFYIGKEE